MEFVASRQSYEWLCDALKVYKPRQSEYGRFNLEGTVMSKRKIMALVNEGYVSGWDDPRLYTLIALRRRGIPPGAITSFVSTLGVSTSTTNTETVRFEQAIRQYLEVTVPRLLVVLRPLKVTLENVPEDFIQMIEKPLHPKIPELGSATVPFAKTLYIDTDDFRLEDSKDYFRLAPGKTVGLNGAPFPITYVSHKMDANGKVIELVCRLENDGRAKKPKAFIQWVAEHAPSGSPVVVDETRLFNRLFNSDIPPSDYKSDLNPNSLEVIKGAMVETSFYSLSQKLYNNALEESKIRLTTATTAETPGDAPHATVDQLVGPECVRFQGMRVAYFALDSDSRLECLKDITKTPARQQGDYIVLNRVVGLKEDSGKTA